MTEWGAVTSGVGGWASAGKDVLVGPAADVGSVASGPQSPRWVPVRGCHRSPGLAPSLPRQGLPSGGWPPASWGQSRGWPQWALCAPVGRAAPGPSCGAAGLTELSSPALAGPRRAPGVRKEGRPLQGPGGSPAGPRPRRVWAADGDGLPRTAPGGPVRSVPGPGGAAVPAPTALRPRRSRRRRARTPRR
ncbi:transcription factor MafK isoform X2 [Hippopotamus amphibius kiboko]|uniref:transcription factor MafK isoform X2 n=1 Tax=Hippopotamus amphibius kiboko TaxID=575201 RepID=UPI002594E690|nr:transcription factor MafK isoform X2 [Hippopotamus amphibius kiboko]XP_057603652.1 transcription factor MafK isoform X2 [Hippopotamus amphibius kiboko]